MINYHFLHKNGNWIYENNYLLKFCIGVEGKGDRGPSVSQNAKIRPLENAVSQSYVQIFASDFEPLQGICVA